MENNFPESIYLTLAVAVLIDLCEPLCIPLYAFGVKFFYHEGARSSHEVTQGKKHQ
jgi:hypothetical protein